MSINSGLEKLHKRAAQADEVLGMLKSQLNNLKQSAAMNAGKNEADNLQKENANLRKEVEQLKLQLILAEIKNGVKYVEVPARRGVGEQKNEEQMSSSNKEPVEKKVKEAEKKARPSNEKAAVSGNIDVSRLDLRVGLIVNAKKHPDADKQYIEEVDVGEENLKTVCSGLVGYIPLEELSGKIAVFLCNLKPARFRGVLSESMLLCACSADSIELVLPPAGSQPGDKITCDGYPRNPDNVMNPKKKIWETVKMDMRSNSECIATYKGSALKVEGKGELRVPSLANVQLS